MTRINQKMTLLIHAVQCRLQYCDYFLFSFIFPLEVSKNNKNIYVLIVHPHKGVKKEGLFMIYINNTVQQVHRSSLLVVSTIIIHTTLLLV
jgi:hypothetical protein